MISGSIGLAWADSQNHIDMIKLAMARSVLKPKINVFKDSNVMIFQKVTVMTKILKCSQSIP